MEPPRLPERAWRADVAGRRSLGDGLYHAGVPRDRHGRAAHVDTDRRRRPVDGFRVRSAARFADLVEDALAALPAPLLDAVARADVRIENIPPDADEVRLADFTPGRTRGSPPRLVVYRRPMEARALSRNDLVDVLRAGIGEEIADALGMGGEFDDLWDED